MAMNKDTLIKYLSCTQCEKTFTTKGGLKRHELAHMRRHEAIHTVTRKTFNCLQCDKRCNSLTKLHDHLRVVHTKETPFSCSICGKTYGSMESMKRHEEMHTNERKCACSKCDKAFTCLKNLKRHELIHADSKPYSCSHCDKQFREQGKVTRHERIHTKEKPYDCSECDKKFPTSTQLKSHERIHTGEKPYNCLLCKTYSCKQKSHLNDHVKSCIKKHLP